MINLLQGHANALKDMPLRVRSQRGIDYGYLHTDHAEIATVCVDDGDGHRYHYELVEPVTASEKQDFTDWVNQVFQSETFDRDGRIEWAV